MTGCPFCGASDVRAVRNRANLWRAVASVPLLAFYVLGGLAGDHRGPLLPLERRCEVCGHRRRRRSVIDELMRRRRLR